MKPTQLLLAAALGVCAFGASSAAFADPPCNINCHAPVKHQTVWIDVGNIEGGKLGVGGKTLNPPPKPDPCKGKVPGFGGFCPTTPPPPPPGGGLVGPQGPTMGEAPQKLTRFE